MKYLLEEDKLIGHDLIVQRNGLFRKKLSLRGVYYNNLIKGIISKFDEVSPELLYTSIHYSINLKISRNNMDTICFRNGGTIIGKCNLEKRINFLQFQFKDSYLKRALEILEEQEN
jgi:hypothetical protein